MYYISLKPTMVSVTLTSDKAVETRATCKVNVSLWPRDEEEIPLLLTCNLSAQTNCKFGNGGNFINLKSIFLSLLPNNNIFIATSYWESHDSFQQHKVRLIF